MDKPENNNLSTVSQQAPRKSTNYGSLVMLMIVIFGIYYLQLNVLELGLAALGLGLVIFIHELGHFLAAKWCDVHVETFSIGFGQALPFCQFKYGETTYKIGWIPLGGFVKMVGEGENGDSEDAEEDPRSFKNKSVYQRMLIISAGVIMNVIMGCTCFLIAYKHGVEEPPAVVGYVSVGSPAWEADIRAGDRIQKIASIEKPSFDDIKPTIMSSSKGEAIPLIVDGDEKTRELTLVATRAPDELYPTIGIGPANQLKMPRKLPPMLELMKLPRPGRLAVDENGNGFQANDQIVACSYDPTDPKKVSDIPTYVDPDGVTKRVYEEFARRQKLMLGKPMIVVVEREGKRFHFEVAVPYAREIPGVRFQMGRLAALRANGPAATAKADDGSDSRMKTANVEDHTGGDRLVAIQVTTNEGGIKRFVEEKSKDQKVGIEEVLYDPFQLSFELEKWAATSTNLEVKIEVLRSPTGDEKTGKLMTFTTKWDKVLESNGESIGGRNAPMAISGLGLAYYIDLTVDTIDPESLAAKNGLREGDIITEVRFSELVKKDQFKMGSWDTLNLHSGAALFGLMQNRPSDAMELKVKRTDGSGENIITLPLECKENKSWPLEDRGLMLAYDTQIKKADTYLDALKLGGKRTIRTLKNIYQTLYATVFRQISLKSISGPLSIANISYKIAGYDRWQFLVFLGLVSINLAVVNFLPIPVMDGGHMVFLIYEKIRGKPAPDRVMDWALIIGLVLILMLFAFAMYNDIRRLFF
ncbi:MAG: RIP metalloprotease RseP [Zavarzinella sp.]